MIRLLILEPQELLRAGLETVFSQDADIEIVGFAANTTEAAAVLLALMPQILLLDECWDAHLIGTAAEAGINTIVFSSSSEKKDIFEALTAGAKAYILKGTSIALLTSAIQAVASGATWLDPIIARKIVDLMTTTSGPAQRTPRTIGPNTVLSPREREVLCLVSEGMANAEIAKTLYIGTETVKTHITHIMDKLQVRTRTEAAIQGIKLGLVNDGKSTQEFAASR